VILFVDVHNFSIALNALAENPHSFAQEMYERLGDIISIIKRVSFQRSRCDTTCQHGSLFGYHVGHFSFAVHGKLIIGRIVAAERLQAEYEPLIYREEDY
jgi:hypothetical protein